MNKKEFVEKYCKNCKELCDKGIIEREEFIRCIDRDIYIDKKSRNEFILKNNQ